MKKKILTALVTPFDKQNKIDYETLKLYIDYQYDYVDGFIVCGTTGETSTLSEVEKFTILEYVLSICNHDKEIYFGCGTNDTISTLLLAKKACNYPINGLLIVTPYYNKPSQTGLYEHYSCIASNVSLPIILYQVESRCNVVFTIETLKKLHLNHLNIIGIKYASKDIEALKVIRKELKNFIVYCGDDYCIKEMNPYVDGVVSVISNLFYREIKSYYEQGDKQVDFFIKRYSKLIFLESNPVIIKYLLSKIVGGKDYVRLPLTTIEKRNKLYIDSYFDNLYEY